MIPYEPERYHVWSELYPNELNHKFYDFKQFCKHNPLIDGYTRTGRDVDKNNMRRFIQKLKENSK